MTLLDVMAALYASEINCRVSSFFDSGWTLQLGDELNGFKAEATFYDFDEAADWLRAAAIEHFPESAFARRAGGR